MKGLFTPQGDLGWQVLDEEDADFGSGGAMLLPPQPGAATNLAVAAGKVGVMYVLNADDISNGKPKTGKAFSTANVGSCWCGPSYYKASDGFGRVVSSGGKHGRRVEGRGGRRQAEARAQAPARQCRRRAVPRLLHQRVVERID